MTFISFSFVTFFALLCLVYFALPARGQRWLLLAASLLFYALGDLRGLPLIVLAVLFSYALALVVAHSPRLAARLWLAVGIIGNLVLLGVFKYFNFFAASGAGVASLLGQTFNPPLFDLFLPLGVSFYTLQSISYLVDVYAGRASAEHRLDAVALYLLFFPKIVAGPLERAADFMQQIAPRKPFDEARIAEGLRLILWGVFKKVVIADRLAIYVNEIYGDAARYQGVPLLIAVIFYAFQIYCDFSSYSDIAVGTARVLGYDLTVNFRQPYLASSVGTFWRRWHISLSFWFRDYLYIPLGGSRVALPRQLVTLLLVFAASGLWHGAAWTFVIWGALHGGYLVVERLARAVVPPLGTNRLRRFAGLCLTFALVTFAWVFFRAESLADAGHVVTHLFDFSSGWEDVARPYRESIFSAEIEFMLAWLAIAVLIVSDWIDARWGVVASIERSPLALRWSLYYAFALLIGVSLWLFADTTQTFIYAQF